MLLTRLAIVVVASLMSGCFDLGIQPKSILLDGATWSASPCRDVNGDGVGDILLVAQDSNSSSVGQPGAWLLSGEDLSPLYSIATASDGGTQLLLAMDAECLADEKEVDAGDVGVVSFDGSPGPSFSCRGVHVIDPHLDVRVPVSRTTAAKQDAKQSVIEPSASNGSGSSSSPAPFPGEFRNQIWLIDPDKHDWNQAFAAVEETPTQDLPGLPSNPVVDAYPALRHLALCGDIDADRVLDWSGLTTTPRSVVLVSGADLHVLRTIPMESRPFATFATGIEDVGDVDKDGTHDWLVGIHVSQSDDHDSPRTCRLGLISLVSGADLHVIRSLERESFRSGAGLQCPVVTIPVEPERNQAPAPEPQS